MSLKQTHAPERCSISRKRLKKDDKQRLRVCTTPEKETRHACTIHMAWFSTAPQYGTAQHSTAHYENAHSSMLMVPSPSLSATLTRRFISSSDSLSPRPRMISASSDGVTFATITATTTATASHDKRAQKTPYFVYVHLVGTSRKNTNCDMHTPATVDERPCPKP